MEVTDEQIYEEFEIHGDNGISPQFLPRLVSELLDVPLKRVKVIWKRWMRDGGWIV